MESYKGSPYTFPPYSIHTLAHHDQIVWFVFYLDLVFSFATYVMQVCLIFIPTLSSTLVSLEVV
jgi:hypothetical protein